MNDDLMEYVAVVVCLIFLPVVVLVTMSWRKEEEP
jgi:hypothetical protein